MRKYHREPQTWVPLLASILIVPVLLATQVWVFWTAWVYLVGGTVPSLGWQTETNLIMVAVTLFVLEPIAVMLARWAHMLVAATMGLLFSRKVPV